MLVRDDGQWQSEPTVIDPEGGFVIQVALQARQPNGFELRALDESGNPVPVDPGTINIVQGLTISDPPLSRTIGVALANDRVRPYFERGTPLPARRTFTHHTVESVAKGTADCALKIPLVQGEFETAHLCRLVGLLEIDGANIEASLPAGSAIEVTLELDRGGQLSARALVPVLDQVFEGVAHLLVPDADPEALEANVEEIKKRIDELRVLVFRSGATNMLGTLAAIENDLESAHRNLVAARGGDQDAAQRTRRSLLDIDARLEEMESSRRWPELEAKTVSTMTWASSWVSEFGTPREQRLFDEIGSSIDRAREERDLRELQRQLRLAQQIGETAYFRDPGAWDTMFESAASRLSEATDLPRAHALVEQGRQCSQRDDSQGLRRVVEKLWKLLPADAQSRRLGFDSGVR
jgi:molecular chaperone DnaK